jgi:prepilin-type N-terminal cleavage/methylation domain-containing protein
MSYLNLKNNSSKTSKTNTGFTLVEMMVAIAVFSIVMVAAMSALLNVIDANNKARAIKTAINNVNFALEGISRDMRMGTDYGCIDEGGDDTVCSNVGGNVGIKYKSPRAYSGKYAYYKFQGTAILECLQKEESTICSDNAFVPITSSEVEITNAVFYVLGTNPLELKQPRMILTLSGKAGKDKIATTFDLQTSISQRTRRNITTP